MCSETKSTEKIVHIKYIFQFIEKDKKNTVKAD